MFLVNFTVICHLQRTDKWLLLIVKIEQRPWLTATKEQGVCVLRALQVGYRHDVARQTIAL